MTVVPTIRGRKSRIGRVCFDERGKMMFFAGYAQVGGNNCKVLLSIEEAHEFARQIGGGVREPLGAKIVRRLAKRYDIS